MYTYYVYHTHKHVHIYIYIYTHNVYVAAPESSRLTESAQGGSSPGADAHARQECRFQTEFQDLVLLKRNKRKHEKQKKQTMNNYK